jgi:hypothetical protein
MQKLLVWLSVILVVVFGGKYLIDYMSHTAHENAATTRVEAFLGGLQPGGDFEEAFNMWYVGSPDGMGNITQDQFNMYVGEMRRWMAQRRLGLPVKTFEIQGATMVQPPEGIEASVVEVSCAVDGTPVVIRVVDGERLAWAE